MAKKKPGRARRSAPATAGAPAANVERHEVAIDRLELADYNPRQIGDAELDALRASLTKFGIVQELVVNRGLDGKRMRVVGGHQRLRVARELGWRTVPCVFVKLDDNHERALSVALNSTKLQGSFTATLGSLLESIQDDDGMFAELRFDELAADVAAAFPAPKAKWAAEPDDPAPVVTGSPVTKRGDLYILGRHRLLCGDSTEAADVKRLLDRRKPHLLVTDPPYGVEYDAKWRKAVGLNDSPQMGKVQNDDRASWTAAFRHFPGTVAYVWHADRFASFVERSLVALGFEMRQQIVWVKTRFAISRGNYHWRHEPCWYAVRKGAKADWVGGRKQDTVWADIVDLPENQRADLFAARIDEERLLAFDGAMTTVWEIRHDVPAGGGHSTQKPVECMARPMRHHGPADGEVYDPFLGSGTTVIAAEMEGRTCLGMEIDPRYCDAIVARWEAFTGRKARRIAASGSRSSAPQTKAKSGRKKARRRRD